MQKLTDDFLKEAVPAAIDSHIDDILKNAEDNHVFSEQFLNKMERNLMAMSVEEKSKGTAKRTTALRVFRHAAAILIFVLCTFGVAMSVEASRNYIISFCKNVYESFTEFFINDGDSSPDALNNRVICAEIALIPDDYTLVMADITDAHCFLQYEDSAGNFICLDQIPSAANASQSFIFDSEDAVCHSVEICGCTGYVYLKSSAPRCDVLWTTEDYFFTLSTSLSEEKTIELANSVFIPK